MKTRSVVLTLVHSYRRTVKSVLIFAPRARKCTLRRNPKVARNFGSIFNTALSNFAWLLSLHSLANDDSILSVYDAVYTASEAPTFSSASYFLLDDHEDGSSNDLRNGYLYNNLHGVIETRNHLILTWSGPPRAGSGPGRNFFFGPAPRPPAWADRLKIFIQNQKNRL